MYPLTKQDCIITLIKFEKKTTNDDLHKSKEYCDNK